MPVKKNHYAEFPDNSNKLSESMRLQMAIIIISITILARRLNLFENARESMELYTKSFEIE